MTRVNDEKPKKYLVTNDMAWRLISNTGEKP